MNTQTERLGRASWVLALCGLIALGVTLAVARPAGAEGEVTQGDFQTFAAGGGRGFAISGHATLIRTGSDQTLVSVMATGLAPNRTYGVHVHNLPCGVANGGGHYQDVVGGAVDAVNEIWPLITTNAAGVGNGFAMNAFRARPEAQAVVIHDTDGARIACADLAP